MQTKQQFHLQLQCDVAKKWIFKAIQLFVQSKQKGILIFGGAGVGKTFVMNEVIKTIQSNLEVKILAHHCSNSIAKLQQMVQVLQNIKQSEKTAFFLDEIDVLFFQNPNPLIKQIIDGIEKLLTSDINTKILIIGLTNRPQRIAKSIRQHFQQKIYLGLPNLQTRLKVSKLQFFGIDNQLIQSQILQFCQLTDEYTISDLLTLIRQANMSFLRPLFQCKHFQILNGKYHMCSQGQIGQNLDIRQITPQKLYIEPLKLASLLKVLKLMKPSVSSLEIKELRETSW